MARLPRLFARHDSSELHEAILATLDLYGQAAREVAQRLAVAYPEAAHRGVREALEKLRPEALP